MKRLMWIQIFLQPRRAGFTQLFSNPAFRSFFHLRLSLRLNLFCSWCAFCLTPWLRHVHDPETVTRTVFQWAVHLHVSR
ncbi:hypothetical protein QE443_001874 [Pantoea ananatis]|nr:hypothetical protein [Pantoea ananatis]MDR6089010.1 hypothetical protein [Pantoea ananatis]PVY87101.1 hypothetical protein C7427_102562 [Pantoea ananatis]PWV68514.1 hypothetical protein C7425_102553 [Pantoea ananatis]